MNFLQDSTQKVGTVGGMNVKEKIMGYRHYLYKIDNKIVRDMQGKTFDELWDKYTPKKEKIFQEMMMEIQI